MSFLTVVLFVAMVAIARIFRTHLNLRRSIIIGLVLGFMMMALICSPCVVNFGGRSCHESLIALNFLAPISMIIGSFFGIQFVVGMAFLTYTAIGGAIGYIVGRPMRQ